MVYGDFYTLSNEQQELFFSGSMKRLIDEIIEPNNIKINIWLFYASDYLYHCEGATKMIVIKDEHATGVHYSEDTV
jgi:hypothetical protein